ncbi:MAG: exonuclease domain-containing protein, partial [Ferruginibacter sp.]
PSFKEVAQQIYDILSNHIFVAHNVNFDYSFVKHQLKAAGFEFNNPKLCSVRLGRKVFPGLPSYSLGNFCRSMGVEIENRHRAMGDATATAILFDKMLQAEGQQQIDEMLKRSSGEQWLPLQLNKKVIEGLPSGPGVYYFHNSKGKVIYVGKAIDIKKRVSSHFTQNNPEKKRQHFLRLIANITFFSCASELHALVLESTEIRRLWPRYNYSQKQPLQKYALYSFEDNRGYLRLAIDKKKKNLRPLYQFNLLHEGQVLLRKMVQEFELHLKLCYIDTTKLNENDFAFLDEPIFYNGKVKRALEALETQLPTFAIVDEGTSPNEKLCLLVERGSFWGMGYVKKLEFEINIESLKQVLQPYADNDFIRNSIYSFAAKHPEKKFTFQA